MRSILQRQPEAAHVYLGSKRTMMEKMFNDANELFWRSAKKVELGMIAPEHFAPFIKERFEATDRGVDADVVAGILSITHGHPYGTQELCYFLWEEVPEGWAAHRAQLETAVTRVLRSEHTHFSRIWTKAPKQPPLDPPGSRSGNDRARQRRIAAKAQSARGRDGAKGPAGHDRGRDRHA